MGKNKRGYNWKARQNVSGTVDNSETDKLATKIALPTHEYSVDTSDSNALVLPSKKRKFKADKDNEPVGRILSKKKRKHLEKVVDRRKKKEERSDLLEKLEKVQADSSLLSQMVSLSSIQTKGLKKVFAEEDWKERMKESGITLQKVVMEYDDVELPKKVKLKKPKKPELPVIDDPNVLGFANSSSDESGSSSEAEEFEDDSEMPAENIEKSEEIEEKLEEVEKIEDTTTKPIETKKVEFVEKFENVPVFRTPEVIESRSKLPIIGEEDIIVDAIRNNDVLIIAGETGSGKTTQVPQFLYEAGFTKDRLIGVTEPRRVAAIAMASRVSTEMNLEENTIVSYQIRFDDKTKPETKIKFMTDGVLLREAEKDPLLKKYSVIIIDEAHERSVSTDILIGHLSRFVYKRNSEKYAEKYGKLKLVIMSATLRVEDFMPNSARKIQLFKSAPPLINVESRQYDVQIHFNRKTPEENGYLDEAFRKICKIHRTLPEGGILVFVTGQDEVRQLVKKLRKLFPSREYKVDENDEDKLDAVKLKKVPKVDLNAYETKPEEKEENTTENDQKENEDDEEMDEDLEGVTVDKLTPPLWTLPLYSKLDPLEQRKVFQSAPENHRLCVISTNVSETSLTIPGVKYVVDTGKMKIRLYDKVTGVSTYQVMNTSKAQADQRAGRAGRQGPGHCYRLYSSAVFQDFEDHARPDIQSRPVEDVVLQLKAMGKNRVLDFPFPSPPEEMQIQTAERHLVKLGALEQDTLKITNLGRTISHFPVAPKYGKMLALSHQHNLTQHTITMVAALSMQEVLLETPIGNHVDAFNKHDLAQIRAKWAGSGNTLLLGDPMVLLSAIYATEYAGCTRDFCDRHGLRFKAMQEIRKLRRQLANEMSTLKVVLDPKTIAPDQTEAFLLRQILLAGLADQVAHRIPLEELPIGEDKKKLKFAYFTRTMEQPVFLHSLSILKVNPPDFVVYQEIYEVQGKMYMRGVTAIDPEWLPEFCPLDCTLSKPLTDREPFYDAERGEILTFRTGTFGERGWILPLLKTVHPVASDRTKYFAKFLLEGEIFPALKPYKEELLSSPVAMIKTWGSLHAKRIKPIFETLLSYEVDNKAKFVKVLQETNPKFLLKQYLLWLDEKWHNEITKLWIDLVLE